MLHLIRLENHVSREVDEDGHISLVGEQRIDLDNDFLFLELLVLLFLNLLLLQLIQLEIGFGKVLVVFRAIRVIFVIAP